MREDLKRRLYMLGETIHQPVHALTHIIFDDRFNNTWYNMFCVFKSN